MKVKTDTKEKFVVFSPQEAEIPANMAEFLGATVLSNAANIPPHVILNLESVQKIAPECLLELARIAGIFREKGLSFVVCCLQNQPASMVSEMELEEILNMTPTESEAWDIVQMEEIEREFLGGFEEDKEA